MFTPTGKKSFQAFKVWGGKDLIGDKGKSF